MNRTTSNKKLRYYFLSAAGVHMANFLSLSKVLKYKCNDNTRAFFMGLSFL